MFVSEWSPSLPWGINLLATMLANKNEEKTTKSVDHVIQVLP